MSIGYTRQDTSNNISNGNVIDADDLDLEFNAVEAAFNSSTGHTHDGSAGQGAPITKVGPAQDLVVSASSVLPKTGNTLDLGSPASQFKDLHIDGVANIDSLVADTATITGGSITGITDLAIADGGTGASTAAGALTNLGLTATAAELNYVSGATSSLQTQLNSKQPLDADLTAIAALSPLDNNFIVGNGAAWVAESDATARTSLGLGTMATQSAASVGITGGSVTGITDLAIADGGTGASTAAGALVNLGLTATATELNYTDGVTSAIQTQLDSKQPLDADLTAIAALETTDSNFIVGNGTTWVAETGATARASLGLTIGSNVLAYDSNLQSFVNTFTLPVTDGAIGQTLTTNGAGILSFTSLSAGATNIDGLSDGRVTGTGSTQTLSLGTNAGLAITSATNLVLIGGNSGDSITTGSRNVAVGNESLAATTTQFDNVAVGYNAASAATSSYCVAIGSGAGANLAGNDNVAIGYAALDALGQTGTRNTAIGANALTAATAGAFNVAAGYGAGLSLTSANSNVILGRLAGADLTTGSNNIILGDGAAATAIGVSNEITIGNSSHKVLRLPWTATVATLPAASTVGAGARSFVTDATVTTFASVVAGGGTNGVPVYSDGTNWRIG